MSRFLRSILGLCVPISLLLASAPPAAATQVFKIDTSIQISEATGKWPLGAGALQMTVVVDLDHGTIKGTAKLKSSDKYATTAETLTMTGTIDAFSGAVKTTISSNYSYTIDADNYWKKSYSGTFNGKIMANSGWHGTANMAFTSVQRVGSVGNAEPAQGVTYVADIQIWVRDNKTLPFRPTGVIEAAATNVSGDVEYSADNGKTFKPLVPGTIIQEGWVIMTGFDSSARLDFGYGSLTIFQTTSFRVDQFSSAKNLKKTQLNLQIGRIAARVHHTDAIRGDFSVTTPTANASVRGSEMIVDYSTDTGETSVYVTEDAAFVKGTKDKAEVTVPQGSSVVVPKAGKASKPAAFVAADLPPMPSFDPATSGAGPSAATGAAGTAGAPTGSTGNDDSSGGFPVVIAMGAAVVVLGAVVAGAVLGRRRSSRSVSA